MAYRKLASLGSIGNAESGKLTGRRSKSQRAKESKRAAILRVDGGGSGERGKEGESVTMISGVY